METTHRKAVRTVVVARRVDEAKAEEVQEVRVAVVRRTRPIAAVVTDIVQRTIVVVAIAGSRFANSGL